MKEKLILGAVVVALVGCSSTGGSGSSASPLIPNKAIQLTAGTSVSLSTLMLGAAIYLYYDPLAPNWEIEEARLNEDTFRFSMKMKRYHTGGGWRVDPDSQAPCFPTAVRAGLWWLSDR